MAQVIMLHYIRDAHASLESKRGKICAATLDFFITFPFFLVLSIIFDPQHGHHGAFGSEVQAIQKSFEQLSNNSVLICAHRVNRCPPRNIAM